ncbi:hypothetical protein BJ138DRAFT_1119056 [Hygrophoropsis aurantiaca]|uniref:Uncharacterized protein n=1 Tax=Hygrophoropsis aurantiaca TaxID=72124 RepID=A0ACB7ZUQ6_9AGAM|nr:hypothetical protein BJ138DRAFT_1119056 [Hygrophoropsis aurantiaca]
MRTPSGKSSTSSSSAGKKRQSGNSASIASGFGGLESAPGTEFLTGPISEDTNSLSMVSGSPSIRTQESSTSSHYEFANSQTFNRVASGSSTSSLDEPISASVSALGKIREREENSSDPTQLTPRRTKRLKVFANKLADERNVSTDKLAAFIDSGSIYNMLIDIKATLLQKTKDQQTEERIELKELLESSDFHHSLKVRLTACLMSPNLTAYVTDTHTYILSFIQKHYDVFKVPQGIWEDSDLHKKFSKIVTMVLCHIRNTFKTALINSILKRQSIVETVKSLVQGGMEVDAAHWIRFAFLRRVLWVFLIGTGSTGPNYIPLGKLFSRYLVDSLAKDLRAKVEDKLDINISQMLLVECDANQGDDNDDDAEAENEIETGVALDGEDVYAQPPPPSQPDNTDVSASNPTDGDNETADQEDSDSGFGLNGGPAKWSQSKYWNYIDFTLDNMRAHVKSRTSNRVDYDKEFRNLMMRWFQLDLQEYPGGRMPCKLFKTTTPQWQTTIDDNLIW